MISQTSSFVVRGRVTDTDGHPAADVLVRVVAAGLRRDDHVGDARTGPDGQYEFAYSAEQRLRAKKESAELVVFAVGADGTTLGRSPVVFNAPDAATVDLTIPAHAAPEWERLSTELAPILGRHGIAPEHLTREDCAFIAGQTGMDADRIRLWSLALGMEAEQGDEKSVAGMIFYAWLRQGLPETLADQLRQPEPVLRAALEDAGRANVIPRLASAALDDVMARVRAVNVGRALAPSEKGETGSFGDLLHLFVSREAHEGIARAYVDHGSTDNEAFWKALDDSKSVTAADLAETRRVVTLNQLTGGYLPLVKALDSSPQSLARLDEQGWIEILQSPQDPANPLSAPIGIPPGHDSVAEYARALKKSVQTKFPTAAIAGRVEQVNDGPFASLKEDLSTFFTNNPEFSIADQVITAYLSTDSAKKLSGVKRPAELQLQLARMGRVFKFAPAPEPMEALLADDVFSAQAVVLMGEAEFRRRYRGVFGGDPNAAAAYAAAREVSVQALVLFNKLGAHANRPLPAALSAGGAVVDTSSLSAADRATWDTMFGSLELCDCEECQSLAGPAAYLFDTLEFVKQILPPEGANSPLSELLRRRPDLAHLELTCDNTNIRLPYVDLVNEVLENAVTPRRKNVPGAFTAASFDAGAIPDALRQALNLTSKATLVGNVGAAPQSWAIRDPGWRYVFGFAEGPNGLDVRPYPQSSLTESELGANPEHINGPAYAKLARARYPWSLPFNLPVDSARVYLRQLGVERYELMEALAAPSAVLSQDTIVHERLGLTKAEADIITGAAASTAAVGDEPWTFWGFDHDDPAALKQVTTFLAQSGLLYQDLLELLQTYALNPVAGNARTMTLTSTDASDPATCDLKKLQIQGLTTAMLKKIHRFVRLQRALGWSAYDLDRAVTTFAAADFTEPFLRQLAHVQRLKATLGVPGTSVLAFYADIDVRTYPEPSLYAHLFRNRSVVSPVDAAFTENPAQLQGTLSAHSAPIAGALRISASEFGLLTTGTTAVVAADVLSLSNLSALYRNAVLAQGLKLSIPAFLQAKRLIGVDPFADTGTTIRFVERIASIAAAGFTVAELAYLLRHESTDPQFLVAADRQTADLLDRVRDGLRKIADEESVRADPEGNELRKKLAQLNWNAAHVDQLVAIVGSATMTANARTAARTFLEQRARACELPSLHAPTAPPLLTQAVAFPDSLKSRIQYNATDRTVEAVGAFSDAERAELMALSLDNTYRQAIQSLDQQAKNCTPGPGNEFLFSSADPANNPTNTSFTALFDSGKTVAERFEYLLAKVCLYLRTKNSEAFVKQKVADDLKLAPAVVDVLLTTPTLTDPTFATSEGDITAPMYPQQFAVLTRLQKVATFVSRYALTLEQVTALSDLSAAAQWMDWNEIPVTSQSPVSFAAWELLNEASDLRGAPFANDDAAFDLMAMANVASTTKATFLQAVCDSTGWDPVNLQALAGDVAANPGALNLAFPGAFKNGGGLTRLRRCFRLIKERGFSAATLTEWSLPNLAGDIAADAEWARALANADAVKNAVKAKYDDEQWLTLAGPLRNRLRERQRAALVAYLLAQKFAGADESDLFDYFLIDVEMGACMTTTRLMQAICSVQLFVQRCLMNLEPGTALTPDQASEWHTWRRLQRVFQANREVFLYPENWIEPELRDDKSPLFKELESELLQNDVTAATAEEAILHYLEKLDHLARLEIVGLCQQHDPADTDGVHDVLHVFGRTYATPHAHFYRHFDGSVDKGRWSAWEKIDLDIVGDHLIPLMWNRHLYVFWPIFTEKTEQPTKAQRANNEDPAKYWEIQLAWSEFKNGRWLPKKISKQLLKVPKDPSPDIPQAPKDFTFTVQIRQRDPNNFWDYGYSGSQLVINCYGTTVVPPAPVASPAKVTPRIKVATVPAWEPGVDDYGFSFNVTHFKAIVNKTAQTIKVFDKENPAASGSGVNVEPGGYLKADMNAPWANGQGDFNLNHKLQIANISGTTMFAVWQSNVSDGDFVRFSTDGLWHSSGTHVGDINGNHALVVSEAGVSQDGLRNPVKYTFVFLLEGQPLRQSEMPAVALTLNWEFNATTGSRPCGLDNYARAIVMQDSRVPLDMYLTSDRYTIDSNDGVSVADQAYVDYVVTERFVTVKLVPLPAAAVTPPAVQTGTPRRWQAIGRFVSNDCHSDLDAISAAAAFPTMQPASLEPMNRTEYVGMMIAEHGIGSDTFGTATVVLARTPGTFHVLTRPEAYLPTHVSFPFAYQDDQRTYLGTAMKSGSGLSATFKTRFNMLFHPRLCAFLDDLDRSGLPGLLSLATQSVADPGAFVSAYSPNAAAVDLDIATDSRRRTPREDVDFSYGGAYSLYNWELFFHIPWLIATRLTKNQRFEEARDWFHFIFDPTSAEPGGRERFWRFKPFFDDARSTPQTLSDFVTRQSQALIEQIDAWEAHPFQPHVIARLRVMAYMKAVVMKYIDNLIEWGDQLFSRDTLETVNEATQLYILALRILGKRPEDIPARAIPVVQTFESLDWRAASGTQSLNAFGEAIVEIENYLAPSGSSTPGGGASLGTMPLFCIPQNDVLLGYWDTVADRLFKIRHCMNIQGVKRELPIFAPRIDPALLVRAAAAGVDLDSVLSDLYAPLPSYRFAVMQQKAAELCGDVRALGGALLSALEKRDGEALALLRSGHEVDLLNAVRQVKQQQIEEAKSALDGLKKYHNVVTARQQYYSSRPFMNPFEDKHAAQVSESMSIMQTHSASEMIAALLHLIPNTKAGSPVTAGLTYGGSNVAPAVSAFGAAMSADAGRKNTGASLNATLGGYQRRAEDWKHQADLATRELEQVEKQIAAGEIRLAIADLDLQNHDLQINHAKDLDAFMREKYTNHELYDWMVGQIAAVYFQSYKLAYDAARRAERCYRFELGLADSRFIQFGYWDSLKKGLLAGEQLQLDLRRMEMDYLDRNARDYEITKPISLLMQDPTALIRLKETGQCEIELPEWLFDMDYPGHYLRRMKSVSLTIPSVVGPYTTINCTLTLLTNTIRVKDTPPVSYPQAAGDSRFATDFGARQSIATSHAQNDSGMFELNFRDERYLPFEGKGAISRWRIELPQENNGFDLDTITDVVMHLRYTAKAGGDVLRDAAAAAVRGLLTQQGPLVRAFSLRHEFPTEWNRFLLATTLVNTAADVTHAGIDQRLRIDLTDRFPFQRRRGPIVIDHAQMFLKLTADVAGQYRDANPLVVDLAKVIGGVATDVTTDLKLLVAGSPIAGLAYGQLFAGGTGNPGTWEFRIVETRKDAVSPHQDLHTGTGSLPQSLRETVSIGGVAHSRLKPDAVQDIVIICVYRLT